MTNVTFGTILWTLFPFDDAEVSKSRLSMVLVDLGDSLLVAKLTTNHERFGINLGQVFDSKSALLEPTRYARVRKSDVYWARSERDGRGLARIDLAYHREAEAVVRAIIKIARNNGYLQHSAAVLAELQRAVIYADQQRHNKECSCQKTKKPVSSRPCVKNAPTTARFSQH